MKNPKTNNLRYPYILTDILIALVLSAFVLIPGGGYDHIQQTKFSLFLLIFGGYLCLMLLFTAEMLLVGKLRLAPSKSLWQKSGWVQRLVCLYWLFTGLATLFSPYRSEALLGMTRQEGFLTISVYCACFLCVSVFGKFQDWMLHLFGAAMTIFAAISLMQLAGGNPLGLYPAGTNYFGADVDYAGAYIGTIGNADLAAGLLCLAIPIMTAGIFYLKSRWRFWLLLPVCLNLAVLWKLQVQAGLVGILVGGLICLVELLPLPKKVQKWRWPIFGIIVLAFLIFIYYSKQESGTIFELREVLHGNWDDRFGNGRIWIWKSVLKLVPQHLLFGTGPDTLAAAGLSYYTHYAASGQGTAIYTDAAHNEFLNILYHQGIFALLAYLGAVGMTIISWLRKAQSNKAMAMLGCGFVCYLVQAFFGFSMCSVAGIFWLVWAILEKEAKEKEAFL